MARLTAGSIVSAAIEVIRRDGPDRFSMRKLGEALAADPTAIYRHFANKDDLLRAVGDRALEGITKSLPATSWRAAIRELMIRLRAANLAQPALAILVRSGPPRHRNEMLVTETTLAALLGAGLAGVAAVNGYHALIELTIGSDSIDAALAALDADERSQTYAVWRTAYSSLDPAAFPCSVALASSLYPGTADDRFTFALDMLLDGLASLVP
jgi:TetR/AcrR family transcriptional regulator, tetracycline repressor protein